MLDRSWGQQQEDQWHADSPRACRPKRPDATWITPSGHGNAASGRCVLHRRTVHPADNIDPRIGQVDAHKRTAGTRPDMFVRPAPSSVRTPADLRLTGDRGATRGGNVSAYPGGGYWSGRRVSSFGLGAHWYSKSHGLSLRLRASISSSRVVRLAAPLKVR